MFRVSQCCGSFLVIVLFLSVFLLSAYQHIVSFDVVVRDIPAACGKAGKNKSVNLLYSLWGKPLRMRKWKHSGKAPPESAKQLVLPGALWNHSALRSRCHLTEALRSMADSRVLLIVAWSSALKLCCGKLLMTRTSKSRARFRIYHVRIIYRECSRKNRTRALSSTTPPFHARMVHGLKLQPSASRDGPQVRQ